MVWLYRSPFPVGGGGILLVQFISPAFARAYKKGGGGSAPCGINPRNNENCGQLYTESVWISNYWEDVNKHVNTVHYCNTLPLLINEHVEQTEYKLKF
jgi:hypothetical protein